MNMLKNIAKSMLLLYAVSAVYFIAVNNILAIAQIFILLLLIFLLFMLKRPFAFIKIIILCIPTIGLFFIGQISKVVVVLLPFIVTIYSRQLMQGYRILLEKKDLIFYGMHLMFIGVIVSIIFAYLRGALNVSMITHAGLLLFELTLLLLYLSNIDTMARLNKLLYVVWMLAAALVALLLIYSMYANIAEGMYSAKGKNLHFGGFEIHANLVAMILTPLIMFAIPALLNSKNTLKSGKYYILMAMSVVSLILTNTRGAWVGLFCGVCYTLYRLKKVKYLLIVSGIILVSSAAFGNIILSRYNQTNKFDMAIIERFIIWTVAIRYIVSSPFVGLGPDSFHIEKYRLGVPIYIGPINAYSTHNIFLEMAVNYSCFFLSGFLLLISHCFYLNDKKYISDNKSNNNIYLLSINSALIAVLVNSIFDCNIANISFAVVLVMLVALAVIFTRRPYILDEI